MDEDQTFRLLIITGTPYGCDYVYCVEGLNAKRVTVSESECVHACVCVDLNENTGYVVSVLDYNIKYPELSQRIGN